MEEKNRKKTRFLANFDGLYRFSKTKELLDCYIYDISETGTLIRMKQTLVIGDILEICRITSYNVCYTKLLRIRIWLKDLIVLKRKKLAETIPAPVEAEKNTKEIIMGKVANRNNFV